MVGHLVYLRGSPSQSMSWWAWAWRAFLLYTFGTWHEMGGHAQLCVKTPYQALCLSFSCDGMDRCCIFNVVHDDGISLRDIAGFFTFARDGLAGIVWAFGTFRSRRALLRRRFHLCCM